MRTNGVDQPTRVFDAGQRIQHLVRHFLGKLHVLFELIEQYPYERLLLTVSEWFAFPWRQIRLSVARFAFLDIDDIRPETAFDQYLDGTIGQLEQLHDVSNGPHRIEVRVIRVVLRGLALSHQQYTLVGFHRGFQRLYGFLTTNKKRNNHLRVDDDIPQRQQG